MCSRGYLHYLKVWEGPGSLAVGLGTSLMIELVHEVFMPPTFEKLKGHIDFSFSVRACVCPCVCYKIY